MPRLPSLLLALALVVVAHGARAGMFDNGTPPNLLWNLSGSWGAPQSFNQGVIISTSCTTCVAASSPSVKSTTTLTQPVSNIYPHYFYTPVFLTGNSTTENQGLFSVYAFSPSGFSQSSTFHNSGAMAVGKVVDPSGSVGAGGTMNWISGIIGMADNESSFGTLTNAADFYAHNPSALAANATLTNWYGLYVEGGCTSANATNCYSIATPFGLNSGFGTASPLGVVHIAGGNSSGPLRALIVQNSTGGAYGTTGSSARISLLPTSSTTNDVACVEGRYDSTAGGYVAIMAASPCTDVLKITAPTGANSGRLGVNLASGTLPSYALDVRGIINTSAEYQMAKLGSAPGSAPGAGLVQLYAIAGTNAGTCKVVAVAGTSTTPVTIVDNVGSGC